MAVVRWRRKMTTHVGRSVVGNGSVRRVRWVAHRVSVTGMSWMLVVRAIVSRVRRRCVHRTRRPRAWVRRRVAIARASVHGRRLVMRSVSVARRAHGATSDGRNGALLLNSRFRVHALFRADVAKLRVVGRLHEML